MTQADVARLQAEARYHRERLSLYRARAYGSDTTTPGRLRKLEQVAAQADERLRAARDKATAE